MPDESSQVQSSPVDVSTINANVATLRADMREVKVSLSALKADMAGDKADMASVLTDVVRLEQKFAHMAAELAVAQADVRKILLLMATKNDVERILAAIDAKKS